MRRNTQERGKRTKRWWTVFTVIVLLIAAVLCFIFRNSMQTVAESSAESLRLLNALKGFLGRFTDMSDGEMHNLIRKTAHFAEFFCLGVLLAAAVELLRRKTGKRSLVTPFFAVLLSAVIDESIQTLSDRSAEFRDVLIDFSGGVFGILAFLAIAFAVSRLRANAAKSELSGLDHIAILCSDREKSLAFYADALGFVLRESHVRPERNDEVIFLDGYGVTLELFVSQENPPRVTRPEAYGLRHLAFRVGSAERAAAALKAHGYEPEPLRSDTFNGRRLFFCADPDGLPIEFHE